MNQKKVHQLNFDLAPYGSLDVKLKLEVHGNHSNLVKRSKMHKQYKEIKRQIRSLLATQKSPFTLKFVDVDFSQHKYLVKIRKFDRIEITRCEFDNFTQIEGLIKITRAFERIFFLDCSLLEKHLKPLLLMNLGESYIRLEENGFNLECLKYSVSIEGNLNLSTHARLYDRCLAILESESFIRPYRTLRVSYSAKPPNYNTESFKRWFLIPAFDCFHFEHLDYKGLRFASWVEKHWHSFSKVNTSTYTVTLHKKEGILTLPLLKFDAISLPTINLLKFISNPPLRNLWKLILTMRDQERVIQAMEYMIRVTSLVKLHFLQIYMSPPFIPLALVSQTLAALRAAQNIQSIGITIFFEVYNKFFLQKCILGRIYTVSVPKWQIKTTAPTQWYKNMEPVIVASEPESRIYIDQLGIYCTRL